jgi:hypothetical protein
VGADTCTFPAVQAEQVFEASLSFTASPRQARLNCLATWFGADFAGGYHLSNGLNAPVTHWGWCVFPLRHAIDIETGAWIEVAFARESPEQGWTECECWVRINRSRWEGYGTNGAWL